MAEQDSLTSEHAAPFFSVGVTTYNRPALLKQTLNSISQQTFADFEVIVGNDHTAQAISPESLGIKDPRICIVNHPRNLGEIRNMNSLLALARGRYFTWLSDDDLYDPHFLEKVHATLQSFKHPHCVYTSFDYVDTGGSGKTQPNQPRPETLLSGRDFMRKYWSGKLKAMGCTGVFNKAYLQELGGVQPMADTSFALYSEHLLLMRACLLDHVAYIDEPLVRYRIHDASWGCTTKDWVLNGQAGKSLLNKSVKILVDPKLREDFRQNIASVLKFVVTEFFYKTRAQDGCLSRFKALPHLFSLRRQLKALKGTTLYRDALFSWWYAGTRLVWCLCTEFNFKAILKPDRC